MKKKRKKSTTRREKVKKSAKKQTKKKLKKAKKSKKIKKAVRKSKRKQVSNKKSPISESGVLALVEKGRSRGFVTQAEVLNAFPSIEKDIKGNAKALDAIKGKLKDNFIVMSGDTYNDFDLRKMVKKHLETGKLGTIGLMSRDKPSDYGNAVLDGDLIIDFQEKPKQATSHIVNAGIYIFKKEVFELFENAGSIERDVLTKLARIKQLVGYFTMGEYRHFG